MPVPAYSVIADTEIDPESPLTSSLMFRLRDNALSILGVDPADPTPVFTIPPSIQSVEEYFRFAASGGAGSSSTFTTAENIVSKLADDVEDLQMGGIEARDTIGGSASTIFNAARGNLCHSASNIDRVCYAIRLVSVIYSGGSPTGVRIIGDEISESTTAGWASSFDVTVTLANTWQTLETDGTVSFQAKARADSTDVYLQMRGTGVSVGWGGVTLGVVRKSFQSKA